eukprot:TRINITY_DN7567_c0_g1_i1.p1 TRINITY_DN7567_c0_g1~~TRINITY_DN7567_c0_g1_i1.p1  ORF type:complete len:393 (-),score=75.98 TRINITY_DN7567_c0_g1_i1:73-1251(-)
MNSLVSTISRLKETGKHPRFLYTNPIHHNPTGVTLSDIRRKELCLLSVQHQFQIIADETYHLLQFKGVLESTDHNRNTTESHQAISENSSLIPSPFDFSANSFQSESTERPSCDESSDAPMQSFTPNPQNKSLLQNHTDPLHTSTSLYHVFTQTLSSTTDEHAEPLQPFDGVAGVLCIGSFSPIFAPGLRLGWICGPENRIRCLIDRGYLRSGGGLNPFASAMMEHALSSHAADLHVQFLCGVYQERCSVLCKALKDHLSAHEIHAVHHVDLQHSTRVPSVNVAVVDDDITFFRPRGGVHLWIRFPRDTDSKRLYQIATENHGVGFKYGSLFSVDSSSKETNTSLSMPCICVSFAYHESRQLVMGVERLARAWDSYKQTTGILSRRESMGSI